MKADRFAKALLPLLIIGVLSLPPGSVFIRGARGQGPTPAPMPAARVCVLYDFGKPRADYPNRTDDPIGEIGPLAEGPDGDLYGTSPQGGKDNNNQGTVFKISPVDGKLTVLHNFRVTDGSGPQGGLTPDNKNPKLVRYFYGTTYGGGEKLIGGGGFGTIFRIKPTGGPPEILFNFKNGYPLEVRNGEVVAMKPETKCPTYPNCPFSPRQLLKVAGGNPTSAPVLAADGNWYGVTSWSNNQAGGVLYSIAPDGGEDGFKALCIFDPRLKKDKEMEPFVCSPKGNSPNSLVVGNDGNTLYGTTLDYGGHGTVFKATLAGKVTTLHEFKGTDGSKPTGVMQGSDGNLYGTTSKGGATDHGVVYKLSATGDNPIILRSFSVVDGAQPLAGLAERKIKEKADGNEIERSYLYGTTWYGGEAGRGTIFRINRDDGKDFKTIHKFNANWKTTGSNPGAPLMPDSNGNFYGTTPAGGINNAGVFYHLNVSPEPATTSNPHFRECCALGQRKVLDLGEIPGQHSYETGGGPVGHVYTANAGLVDFGHVRDNADMTKHIYDTLAQGNHSFETGNGKVSVATIPSDPNEILGLAGAIAYVDSWAYELKTARTNLATTWSTLLDWFAPSSFSPEDLPSNMIGIELGRRALKARCEFNPGVETGRRFSREFNAAVDIELDKLMKELNAQPKQTGEAVFDNLKGKWYDLGPPVRQKRHNFYGTLWVYDFTNQKWIERTPPSTSWLSPAYFQPYYSKFTYVVTAAVDGETGVTLHGLKPNMQSKTDDIRNAFVAENPGTDKP